ncbi:hypothetical protein F0U60_43060 [Archangium minus]|uniref:Uncharacterized protein n=1 Tax=Archangium minus TaxID=83450 RepID=A0ABY9X417_9BACT|nr:hypothetical protein F0U60_43060 [Archangium minus]
MNKLVALLARGQTHTPWSELAPELCDVFKTHPAQIFVKADRLEMGVGPEGTVPDSEGDRLNRQVYEWLRAAFQAKPDLVIVLPERLLVFEAKLMEPFEKQQMERTRVIAGLWSSDLLCELLGYPSPKPFSVEKLGDVKTGARLTWQDLQRISADTYPPNDRTRIALDAAAALREA